jgi:hypothetical protein
MLNSSRKPYDRSLQLPARSGLLLIVALAAMIVCFQSACSKKNKVAIAPVTGVRIALLPFNVPPGNQDLRWAAMAAPIMMAKASEYPKALEVTPLWQSMPIALEAAGASRSYTPDAAAYIASWLAVKWSAMGEITTHKTGVSMLIDFVPARTTQTPFRFIKAGSIDTVAAQIPLAYNQFFYYLGAKPLDPVDKKMPTITTMRSVAEALDREYGWFVEADPGKAQQVVANLANTDLRLARLLFNPTLYPVLAQTK